jgi:hypothetical protein
MEEGLSNIFTQPVELARDKHHYGFRFGSGLHGMDRSNVTER